MPHTFITTTTLHDPFAASTLGGSQTRGLEDSGAEIHSRHHIDSVLFTDTGRGIDSVRRLDSVSPRRLLIFDSLCGVNSTSKSLYTLICYDSKTYAVSISRQR